MTIEAPQSVAGDAFLATFASLQDAVDEDPLRHSGGGGTGGSGSAPLPEEIAQLRIDVNAAVHRYQVELRQQLDAFMHRQDMLAEQSLAWQRRVEATLERALKPALLPEARTSQVAGDECANTALEVKSAPIIDTAAKEEHRTSHVSDLSPTSLVDSSSAELPPTSPSNTRAKEDLKTRFSANNAPQPVYSKPKNQAWVKPPSEPYVEDPRTSISPRRSGSWDDEATPVDFSPLRKAAMSRPRPFSAPSQSSDRLWALEEEVVPEGPQEGRASSRRKFISEGHSSNGAGLGSFTDSDVTRETKGGAANKGSHLISNHSIPGASEKGSASNSATCHKKKMNKKKANQFIMARKASLVAKEQTRLQKLTSSKAWEWANMALIMLNAISIGWSTQIIAACSVDHYNVSWDRGLVEPTDCALPGYFTPMQVFFTFAFLIDLMARWHAEGVVDFFKSADVGWNIFDTVIVSVSTLEMILVLFSSFDLGGISVIRVLRVLRIVRVVRVIRVMPFFRELRIMIDSIIGSMKSFMWSMMVMSVMFYIFGISITAGVSTYLAEGNYPLDPGDLDNARAANDYDLVADLEAQGKEIEDLVDYFGSLKSCMLTLYMAMSGGKDWYDYYVLLERHLPPMYPIIFLFCISLAIFAVVNVVMAVFVESSLQASGSDKETRIQEEIESQRQYMEAIQEVFEEMDDSNDGTISIDEFEKHVSDERVIAYFNTLKLDVSDARTLFKLLDQDDSGSIEIHEFVQGCNKLKGESRSLEIAVMRHELAWMHNALVKMLGGGPMLQAVSPHIGPGPSGGSSEPDSKEEQNRRGSLELNVRWAQPPSLAHMESLKWV